MKINVYSLLVTKPHNAHYLSRYIKFIKSCDNTSSNQVTEDHHILPKSRDLFPEYKSFKKYPENKVKLTLRQHYLAHRMLWRAYRGEMARAFTMMCHRTKSFSSRDYENARQYQKTLMTGVNNPNHDGHHSKKAWEDASSMRRKNQSNLMTELNKKHKSKPKETRQYRCVDCSKITVKLEFCHHPIKLEYICRPCSCRRNSTISAEKTKGKPKLKMKGRPAWNKGLKNDTGAENGRKSASKQSKTVTGRKRKYLPDGSWTWEYPLK